MGDVDTLDFKDMVEDSSFLNSLQQGINPWVKEMRKVTKLDRDPSSGTTLQEVSFWVNLKRVILKLQDQRKSMEVELTMEVLKLGKRFHAPVSIDTDTRLMVVPCDEFEKVMRARTEIFLCWDEEFEKLQAQLRDDDEMKMICPAHKKLQCRMEHIKKFRRQHEQLRSVIERALRPDQKTGAENANEEVRKAYALVEEVDVLEITKEGQEA